MDKILIGVIIYGICQIIPRLFLFSSQIVLWHAKRRLARARFRHAEAIARTAELKAQARRLAWMRGQVETNPEGVVQMWLAEARRLGDVGAVKVLEELKKKGKGNETQK